VNCLEKFHIPVHANEFRVFRIAPVPALLDPDLAWAFFSFYHHFAVEGKGVVVELRIMQ
jgi:hypothetical protein